MDEGASVLLLEESSAIYNIKHRAFYFAKEVVLFIGKQKYERIYFSMFDQLIRAAHLLELTWLKEWQVLQKMIF